VGVGQGALEVVALIVLAMKLNSAVVEDLEKPDVGYRASLPLL